MSEGSLTDRESLSLSRAKRVDESCDRFEAAWKSSSRPSIEDYLAGVAEPDLLALLRALVALEIELRSKGGERPAPDEYERRFPDHRELIQAIFSEAGSVEHGNRDAGEPSTIDRIPDVGSEVEEFGLPASDSPPALPERIGRYKICRKLGGGTYGDVFLGQDEVFDRQVAIKVPSHNLLASQNARDQFLSEARSVGRLEHEGIVRALDFGQEAHGRCYIVYQFVDGTTLAERIKPERITKDPLPPEQAAKIIAQIAEALHYAHLQGLVHRDIKPANILLDRQQTPRITDFGLAVREEDLPKERGRLAGTLPYMSPEQVRREAHLIDGRTDIYSLGVVLYELLCGRRPFEGKTQGELEDQILHREAKPPRQIKDSIPQQLERVCLKALSKGVHDRYTTAKDMAEEILQTIQSTKSDRSPAMCIPLHEVDRRMASADEDELRRLLRLMRHAADPVYVPPIFRCLGHPSEAVRQQARQAVHTLGWDKVSDAAEELARRGDRAGITAVLDGLAAFEAHPKIVALLDRLLVLLKGDLRNRTILLLERKRLGLELDAVAALFRDIHSPYRIARALGQGLFTAAYLAQTDGTDLAVVVGVLRPEFVGQPHLRSQFLDVNKKALLLVHENVVLTREVRAFPERNIYFAVRDYVDGVTLQKLLERGRRFAPTQILELLRQLLAALGAIHRRGMSHGGVKPSNVFVCADDRLVLGEPSLPAQGIGVALDRLSYDYRYAAPETFQSGGTTGPQSDLYSLGCVVYELACGEPPFIADNYLVLATRHMREPVVPPSERGSRLGPMGDRVLMKLLARTLTDRYVQVDDVGQDLAMDELLKELRCSSYRHLYLKAAPSLLDDTSLARIRATESVVGFDASAASLRLHQGETDISERVSGQKGGPADERKPRLFRSLEEDLQTRWRRGERVLVEAYLEQFPHLQATPDYALDLIYAEKVLREERGETVRLEEYLARFPQWKELIQRQFELHDLMVRGQVSPERIADYDILATLGRGGMGIVYKARDRRLDRVVALKVLHSRAMDEEQRLHVSGATTGEQLTRFRTEARAVARLQHPLIVQIYEIGEYEGLPFVALEFVSGGSLAENLRKELPAPRAAAELVAKLAWAVQHAHGHGVLHRDLKPSNVLLTSDGQPKITDFGLAKMQELPNPATTQQGMILGTPAYMSPEQASGNIAAIGPATDIYCLGAILYESLTGRPPFQGANTIAILSQLATGRVVSPDAINPNVDFELSTICLKCLEKDPEQRFPSAKALAEDLESWLAGQPIQARRASKISRLLRWYRVSLASLFGFRKRS
jgi:serine/threonine protein kinase